MKVIADSLIPNISEFFPKPYFDLDLVESAAIDRDALHDADLFIGRSVTAVQKSLLQGTKVQMVGSASSGIDHVDGQVLRDLGIYFCAAEGCNAQAVTDYILCVIAYLKKHKILQGKRAGIIGVGRVGSRVSALLQCLGFETFTYDPPRAERDPEFKSIVREALYECDLITVHASLCRTGDYPSYHLIDETMLQSLKPGCVLINAARGALLDSDALLNADPRVHFCLDVFEKEPEIDMNVLKRCLLATPHIAGHTIEGKQRASMWVAQKIYAYLGLTFKAKEPTSMKRLDLKNNWHDLVLTHYNPSVETNTLKMIKNPTEMAQHFSQLRNAHTFRHDLRPLEFATGADFC